MKALNVLYGGRLAPSAFENIPPEGEGRGNAFSLSLAASRRFPGAEKTFVLALPGALPPLPPGVEAVVRPAWTRKILLEEIARLSAGYDFAYFAWADSPLLDASLAGALAARHTRYAAEYSYADGWPYGFAPEIIAPSAAGILAKIAENDDGDVGRDALFDVLQKDINAFDIETEISPVDLRPHRLSFTADGKRGLLLVSRFLAAGFSGAADAERFIKTRPELLRTFPAFFNIQVTGACPQTCSFCPWPSAGGGEAAGRKDYMPAASFAFLLDRISDFAGDAVISVSLWGEPSLHPEFTALAGAVLDRPALSLVVETSGIGWKRGDFEALAAASSRAEARKNRMAPLSWIVSIDAAAEARYRETRGAGFSEAVSSARTLLALFPKDTYVQALRVKGNEDDIEQFYRAWKAEIGNGEQVIIQKYDDFSGALPKLQASDLSPVKRRSCWHILRDMNILLDGRVPVCREDLAVLGGKDGMGVLGNVFSEDLSAVWERGALLYGKHCAAEYEGICADCDEYYTYNF